MTEAKEIKTIKIGDQQFAISSLNEKSVKLIQNTKMMDKIITDYENRIKDLQIKLQITKMAKSDFVQKLINEAKENLLEVKNEINNK